MAGWVSSEFAWKTGKTYTYVVRGRMMTGMSEIDTQYSGIEMDYKILLTVVDKNTLVLKPTEFTIVEVHDKLHGGWRDSKLKDKHPIELKGEFLHCLESPIVLMIKDGVIDTIKVEKELPVWAVNIKKAQVSHFVLDTTGVNIVLEGNLNRKVEHLHQDKPFLESGHFFETLEKTIHGECKTYYTVSQNGAFVKPFPFQKSVQPGDTTTTEETQDDTTTTDIHHGELTWHKTWHKYCHENDQVFEIIKSVNFSACSHKPVFGFFAPSVNLNSRAGDNTFGSFGLRAMVSRILACGKSRKEFTILKIRQEEQINVGLHHTEKLVAGAIKNVTLVDVCDSKEVPKLKDPVVIDSLVYNFHKAKVHDLKIDESEEMIKVTSNAGINVRTLEQEEEEQVGTTTTEGGLMPKPKIDEAPLNTLLVTPIKIDEMKHRVETLMREIVDDLMKHGKESLAEKETLSKMTVVCKILRYWKYDDIETMYKKIANKKTTEEDRWFHHVFLNCVCIAGTNPNIKFIFDLITKNVIVGEHACQMLMTLPMYIRTPTKELLHEYFKLVKTLPTELGKRQVKTTAILSFTTLIHQACVNTNIRNTRYPVHVYGTFCDDKFVHDEFLEFFIKELEKIIFTEDTEVNMHWKVVYLTAIGNIGHPGVIPLVQKCMDNIVNPFIKVKAVFALKHMIVSRQCQNIPKDAKVHPIDRDCCDIVTDKVVTKKVLPILVSVAFDKGEHPEVRNAAISLLMYTTNADITIWQQLAYMTWFEVSEQVKCFVYTSLRNMAGLERPIANVHWKLQKRARFCLSLCKPCKASWTSSHNLFDGDFLEHHMSGYFYQLSTFGSKDSILPNNLYFRNYLQFGDNGFGVNPLEFSIHGHSTQRVINYIMEKLWSHHTDDTRGHEDLTKIHEILGIKDRKMKDKLVASIYVKIRNEIERMFVLNKEKIDRVIREITEVIVPKLRTTLPIEWHKTLMLGEHVVEVPCIFGIPITYKYKLPVHMSVKGHMKLATEGKAVQIQADIHPVYAWKMHHKLAIKVPFLHKKYESGVQQHLVTELPMRCVFGRGDKGEYIFAVTPTHLHETTPSTELHLITFHQKPYTAIIKDSLCPLHKTDCAHVKLIHTLEHPVKKDVAIGEKTLGWKLRMEVDTDYKKETETTEGWWHFIHKFKSPMGLLNMGYVGHPLVRRSMRRITLDMTKSETKTLVFVVGGKKWVQVDTIEEADTVDNKSTEETDTKDSKLGHVFGLAVVGKKTAITRCEDTKGVQKVLTKGTPSTIEILVHTVMTRKNWNVRWTIGSAVKEACKKLPENIHSLFAIRIALCDSTVEFKDLDYCMEMKSVYDRPNWANRKELIVLRKKLLSQDLTVKMKTEIKFGKTCSDMKHVIKMDGEFKRDTDQTEWARDKSHQAKKCTEDEKKGFTVSPVCLWVSEHQAAALNKIKIDITWTDLPEVFKRLCFRFEDVMKNMLFPYMTHDHFPVEGGAGDKKMVVNFHMVPNKEFLHMTIIKPHTRLFFKNVHITNPIVKKILPFTATQNTWENVRDRTLRTYSEPMCTLEGKFVSTFDNVTYKFSEKVAEHCEHVLTKDCSGKHPMAVLVI
jgi:hypothetical protein